MCPGYFSRALILPTCLLTPEISRAHKKFLILILEEKKILLIYQLKFIHPKFTPNEYKSDHTSSIVP